MFSIKTVTDKYRGIEEVSPLLIQPKTILFFDMDGTLVDTKWANYLAYNKAVTHVIGETLETTYDPKNRVTRETIAKMFPQLTFSHLKRIINAKERFYNLFLNMTELIMPVYKLLTKYCSVNETHIVTNCRKSRALQTLQYHRLIDKVSSVITMPDRRKRDNLNKYEFAINRLSYSPDRIVVVENEYNQINDATHSGIPAENIVKV